MKIVFIGAGYCSEFITGYVLKNSDIIGIHKKKPFNIKYKNFKEVKRYDFQFFLKNKKEILTNTTHILVSIPPDNSGDIIIDRISKELISLSSLIWIGYFSSTSVYGNYDGCWVNENSKLMAKNQRGINRIKAEKQYRELFYKYKLPVHIFRLPGIYGPTRSIIERLKAKKVLIVKKSNHFFSRIYVKDLANAVVKSFLNPTPGEIYNISDDYPCSSEEVTRFACNLINVSCPKEVNLDDNEVGEMTRTFYLDNKKVSNEKLKKKLDWRPEYKDYKIGLKDIWIK